MEIQNYRKPENINLGTCEDCNKKINRMTNRCVSCHNKNRQVIKWPSVNKLIDMLSESNFYALEKQLGIIH